MKKKLFRLVLPAMMLAAAGIVIAELASNIVQRGIYKDDAAFMERIGYLILLLGLINLNANLQNIVENKKAKVIIAFMIPIISVVTIYLINNYLHYLEWNSLPPDGVHIPLSYFLEYDITYTIGVGKFRYVGVLAIMLICCPGIYFILGGDLKSIPIGKTLKQHILKMCKKEPRLSNIETPHLLLRGPLEGDLQVFNDIAFKFEEYGMTAADEGILFCGKDAYEFLMEEFLMGDMDSWIIARKETNQMIGMLHIRNQDKFNGLMELSLTTLREMREDTEAIVEVLGAGIEYAFSDDSVNRVTIESAPYDQQRGDALRRLGFHFDGTMRESVKRGDGYKDVEIYSLLRREFCVDPS